VITNTVEDMEAPTRNMMRAILIAIVLVGLLYVLTSIAVLGNLPLEKVIEAKDYALAEAAKPVFGEWGFKIMAVTALIATASAINATLYAATEIGYTLAIKGELPKVYTYNVFHSYSGLIISGILIVPMILFLNLSQVTTIAALVVLIIQGLTHTGHIFKVSETGANKLLVAAAAVSMFLIAATTLYYTSTHKMPLVALYVFGAFVLAYLVEITLRLITKRVIKRQIHKSLFDKLEDKIETLIKK
jgi:amino acid transporter